MRVSKRTIIIVVLVLLFVGLGLAYWFGGLDKLFKKEPFSFDGAVEGVSGVRNAPSYSVVDAPVSTFADIVAPASYSSAAAVGASGSCAKLPLPPKAGVLMDNRDLLPDANFSAVAYDVDISDASTYLWRPSVRASIHNRQRQQADPLRGDIPITKTNSVSNNGWFASRYSEGDAKLDAYFSSYGQEKFRELTGMKSYPMHVANESLIMDIKPQGDALTMDWY